MGHSGFTSTAKVLGIAIIIMTAGAGFYLYHRSRAALGPLQPTPCTQETQQCPDGSYVGRTGPHCEFSLCPSGSLPPSTSSTNFPAATTINFSCTVDTGCPSSQYSCEAVASNAAAYPNSKPSDVKIIEGRCKLNAGGSCGADADCRAGLLCHAFLCTEPIGKTCTGPNDLNCPSGYQCIQGCGPPVVRENQPPPPYFCELEELAKKPRRCPK